MENLKETILLILALSPLLIMAKEYLQKLAKSLLLMRLDTTLVLLMILLENVNLENLMEILSCLTKQHMEIREIMMNFPHAPKNPLKLF